jgi:hypothetical protein
MERFIAKTNGMVHGVLNGFDRLWFRGSLRLLSYLSGMAYFMSRKRMLMKEFLPWAEGLSKQVAAESAARAERCGRPLQYLASAKVSKEEFAMQIAQRDQIEEGLICILSCVEPCTGYTVYRNRERKTLDLQIRPRKCLHHYHYLMHPQFGLCHLRLQTWVPFQVKLCLNGREWLARQMRAAGIGFVKRENCFTWVADVPRAQALLDEQLAQPWEHTLEGLLNEALPSRYRWLDFPEARYYWSLDQSEWASDFMFRSAQLLQPLYPPLIRHAMQALGCEDVLRFLGRVCPASAFHPAANIQVLSDLRRRPEGVRIRHAAGVNSVKMYDKQGSVLRLETTINDIRDFREKQTDRKTGRVRWRRMRKGVVALRRRAEVSQAVNNRYADALAAAHTDTPVGDLIAQVTQPVVVNGRRFRSLNPWAEGDALLLKTIANGQWLTNGFRNRDLRQHLYRPDQLASPEHVRRASAAVSRTLAILRAHHLIRKVSGSHRYQLTPRGHQIAAAILNVHHLSLQQVMKAA